jgi:short-subunit dehydrogenase
MSYWQDKVALVTGGSAGLGRHIAEAFAARGCRVAIAARSTDRLEDVASSLRRSGYDVTAFTADITQAAQVERLVAEVRKQCGRLDVLVNNAGRSARGSALETTPEQFQQLWELNFLGTVRCTRAAMACLTESRGHLVNIGSLASKAVGRYLGGYPASKFAAAAYTHQLRLELRPRGVHVLLVCPGPVGREDGKKRYDDQVAGLPEAARQPGGGVRLRTICPERLAAQIVRACERRRAELVVPARARWLFAVSQLWPALGDWVMRTSTRR